MPENTTIMWCAFAMASSLVLLVFIVATGRKSRLNTRLQELSSRGSPVPEVDTVANLARSTLPKMGAPLMPKTEGERTKLQTRLTHAGLYSPQAMVVFLGVKMVLMVAPALIGVALGVVGLVPITWGLLSGAIFGISGMIGPSFWLDRQKSVR